MKRLNCIDRVMCLPYPYLWKNLERRYSRGQSWSYYTLARRDGAHDLRDTALWRLVYIFTDHSKDCAATVSNQDSPPICLLK